MVLAFYTSRGMKEQSTKARKSDCFAQQHLLAMLQENGDFEPLFSFSTAPGEHPKSGPGNDFTFNMPYTSLQQQRNAESPDRLYYGVCGATTAETHRLSDLAVTDGDNSEEDEEERSSPETPRVKRPMNAFMVWAKEERARLSAERTHKHNADLSRLLGQRWREMSDSEKAPYRKEAQQLAQRHKREHPEYRYRPRRRQSAERKVRGRRISSEDLSRVKAALTPEQLSAYMARGGLRKEQRSQSSASLASLASSGSASSNSIQNTSWDDLRLLADSADTDAATASILTSQQTSFSTPVIDRLMKQIDKKSPPPPKNLPSCVDDRRHRPQCPSLLLLDNSRRQDWCAIQNGSTKPLSPSSPLHYSAQQPLSPTTPSGACTPSFEPPPLIEAKPSPQSSLLPPLQTIKNLPITPTLESSTGCPGEDPTLFNWLPLTHW